MGYVPLDQRSAQFLFRLISRRYQKGSVILTSNKSYGEWGDVVSDYVLATAMLEPAVALLRRRLTSEGKVIAFVRSVRRACSMTWAQSL